MPNLARLWLLLREFLQAPNKFALHPVLFFLTNIYCIRVALVQHGGTFSRIADSRQDNLQLDSVHC